MSVKREQRKVERTPKEQARIDAIREKYQREKPGPQQLAASGEYEGPVQAGAYWEVRRVMAALKAERERQGLTLAELAERSGLDKGAISKLDTGRQVNPTFDTLSRIAAGLDVRVRLRLPPDGTTDKGQGVYDDRPAKLAEAQDALEPTENTSRMDPIGPAPPREEHGGDSVFPHEEEVRHRIEAAFAAELSFSADVFKLGLDAIGWDDQDEGGRVTVTRRKGVNDLTFYLALGLFAKVCNQHRSVTLLCRRGYGDAASILTRAMFESVLALHFLLKPRINLKENGKPFKPDPKKSLTTQFRSWLYLAHAAFQDEELLNNFQGTPLLKSLAKRLGDPATIAALAQEAEKRIGAHWASRVRKRGFAGVSIRDLAESLRVLPWYKSVYALQSTSVHAGDALAFVEPHGQGFHCSLGLGPNTELVKGILRAVNPLFLGAVAIMDWTSP